MTFIINSIKEGFNKKYNVEFVLGVDSPLLAKKIMEEIGIIVLSLKEYKEDARTSKEVQRRLYPSDKPTPEDFGNIKLTFPFQKQDVTIIAKYEGTLQECCSFFLMLGFPITYVNNITNPISNEEAIATVAHSIEESKKIQESQKVEVKQKEVAERKIYDDPKLQIDKAVIERNYDRTEAIIKMSQGLISGKEIKLLREKEDELKKLKLGTNHERIKELVQEMTTMLDNIQEIYYTTNKDIAKPIMDDSIVTDFDLTRGLDTRDKVTKLKEVGAKIKPNEQQYLSIGKYFIYPNILWKDILHLFTTPSHLTNIVYNAYDLREMAIAFILIQSSFWMIANTLFLRSDDSGYAYFYSLFVSIGLIGLISRGARFLRQKNLSTLILLIPAIIILYYILIGIINNNFSL